MKIVISTPLSRPQNVLALYDNIVDVFHDLDWLWFIAVDRKRVETINPEWILLPGVLITSFVGGTVGACAARNMASQIFDERAFIVNHDDDCLFTSDLGDMLREMGDVNHIVHWNRSGECGPTDHDINAFGYPAHIGRAIQAFSDTCWDTAFFAEAEKRYIVVHKGIVGVRYNALR